MIRSIIETQNGFVNATFKRGHRLPESFSYNQDTAQTFTLDQAETLMQMLENNNIYVKRAFYCK